MSIRFKEAPKSLCHTCVRSTILKGDDLHEKIYCHALEGPGGGPSKITTMVQECTSHQLKGTLQLYELERMAWLIDIRKNQIGFFQPKSKEHQEFMESHHRKKDYVDPMSET